MTEDELKTKVCPDLTRPEWSIEGHCIGSACAWYREETRSVNRRDPRAPSYYEDEMHAYCGKVGP